MKIMITTITALASMFTMLSCSNNLLEYEAGDFRVQVEAGQGWLHDYPLFLGINKKNPPQLAIWMEDTEGRYLSTLYASHKVATQGWVGADGNRRKEALPYWCHQRGEVYADGLYLPTRSHPLVDAMTGATPRETFDLRLQEKTGLRRFHVMVEVNHSIDFNARYRKDLHVSDPDYSGGPDGSGQPALVYQVDVDLDADTPRFEGMLVGRSSADGSDGRLYDDLDGITSALSIVKRITVTCL